MIDDDDAGEFDPNEMEEISEILERIFSEEINGYEIVFFISHADAKNLLASYSRYMNGSADDARRCMYEFHKIIQHLQLAVEEDEQGN